MKVLYVLLALVCMPMAHAALIYGGVYDYNLDRVGGAIVSIDSVPQQRVIAEDGRYELDVGEGNYTINASRIVQGEVVSSAVQTIEVKDDGNYRVDMILFPVIDEDVYDDISLDLPEDEPDNRSFAWLPIVGAVILLLIFVAIIRHNTRNNEGNDDIDYDTDGVVTRVYAYVCKHKHTTQKQIRKAFPLSEAKISLIISDLESQGKIRKIRKGRANIIVKN